MAKMTLELNEEGVRKLLQSKEAQDMVMGMAQNAADRCGDGFEASMQVGKYRAIASVAAKTRKAKKRNLEDNIILKSLGG